MQRGSGDLHRALHTKVERRCFRRSDRSSTSGEGGARFGAAEGPRRSLRSLATHRRCWVVCVSFASSVESETTLIESLFFDSTASVEPETDPSMMRSTGGLQRSRASMSTSHDSRPSRSRYRSTDTPSVTMIESSSRAARDDERAQHPHAVIRQHPWTQMLSTSPSRHARTGRATGRRTCREGAARRGVCCHEPSLHVLPGPRWLSRSRHIRVLASQSQNRSPTALVPGPFARRTWQIPVALSILHSALVRPVPRPFGERATFRRTTIQVARARRRCRRTESTRRSRCCG